MGKLEGIALFLQRLSKGIDLVQLQEESPSFYALCRIYGCLEYIAKNRIEPNSTDGKHVYVELEAILATVNQEFMKMGVNPNLSVNWQLCEAEKE